MKFFSKHDNSPDEILSDSKWRQFSLKAQGWAAAASRRRLIYSFAADALSQAGQYTVPKAIELKDEMVQDNLLESGQQSRLAYTFALSSVCKHVKKVTGKDVEIPEAYLTNIPRSPNSAEIKDAFFPHD
jgi:hypothetical protein